MYMFIGAHLAHIVSHAHTFRSSSSSHMQVDSQWTNKDYQGAQRASLYAKRWSIAALAFGGSAAALLFIYIFIQIIFVIIAAASY